MAELYSHLKFVCNPRTYLSGFQISLSVKAKKALRAFGLFSAFLLKVFEYSTMVALLSEHYRWTYWTRCLPDLDRDRAPLPRRAKPERGTARQLDAEAASAFAEEYQAGATVYELAARFKIHRDTVSQHLRRQGVVMRRCGLSADQVDQAVRLFDSGMSLARIGERFDVDAHTVRSALLKLGVRMRDTHGRER